MIRVIIAATALAGVAIQSSPANAIPVQPVYTYDYIGPPFIISGMALDPNGTGMLVPVSDTASVFGIEFTYTGNANSLNGTYSPNNPNFSGLYFEDVDFVNGHVVSWDIQIGFDPRVGESTTTNGDSYRDRFATGRI